ncbi:hypothetical protein CISIN_1g0114101mg, partial [Citrus sinensis]
MYSIAFKSTFFHKPEIYFYLWHCYEL